MSTPLSRDWRLRNWRLRTKLAAVLVVPLVLVGTLASVRVAASVQDARVGPGVATATIQPGVATATIRLAP